MGSIESDEAALWARGRDGHGAAFGEIFDLYKDRVFRHAFRLLRDRHDAEDVTGTAFLELWRRRASVRVVGGSVLPWLIVVTTNAALNTRRSTRRYRTLLDKVPRGDVHPSAEDEALARADALSPDLHDRIRQLDGTDRGLVVLVIIEGYPVADAAGALGITPGTARTRLSRLRERLRTNLAGVEGGAESRADRSAPGHDPDPDDDSKPTTRLAPEGGRA
jgi:RNA polymerase sigma-70 factor (ECF subfamily)